MHQIDVLNMKYSKFSSGGICTRTPPEGSYPSHLFHPWPIFMPALWNVQFCFIGGVWAGQKTSQYLVWPPFALRSAHLLQLIRLLIVGCGMLVHSYSVAVQICWILAGTGTPCRIHRSRASQTCSMGDMSSEYDGHARTEMLASSRNCVQILATWGCASSCCNMSWWSWMALCIQNAISKMHLCSLSITYACPPPAWATRSITLNQQTPHPHDATHAVCHLPWIMKTGNHPWREHLSNAIECEHLPTQAGYSNELRSGRDPNEDDKHAD